jgi:hypothetical protein
MAGPKGEELLGGVCIVFFLFWSVGPIKFAHCNKNKMKSKKKKKA